MTGPIFDTHAHYSACAFDADRYPLLDSLPGKGVVGVCEQATHSGDAQVLELAHRYPWVVAAVGIHPESLLPAADCGEEGPGSYGLGVRRGLGRRDARSGPVLRGPQGGSCGECGLDYHWPVPKDAQLAMFEAHIRLALELDKPIIVHDRTPTPTFTPCSKNISPRASSTAIPAVPTMRCAGKAGTVHRFWRGVYLQGCQAGGKSHQRPAAGKHRAGDRLPLHGTGAGARHPL